MHARKISDARCIPSSRVVVAEHQHVASEVGTGIAECDEVVDGRPAHCGIGGCQVQSRRFRQQPVQSDDLQPMRFGHGTQFTPPVQADVGDSWRQREGGDLDSLVAGLSDELALSFPAPVLKQFLADRELHRSVVLGGQECGVSWSCTTGGRSGAAYHPIPLPGDREHLGESRAAPSTESCYVGRMPVSNPPTLSTSFRTRRPL